ncbi:MAG: sodium:alanine symporter family protein, partial [Lachnospiraceae bacterium]|nr:sodium:alanine symporter family protein [Lachnospiraceae bacterium]
MEQFIQKVTDVNSAVNSIVWGVPMLVLLIGTGVLMTVLTGFFQVTKFKHTLSETIGGLFKKESDINDKSEKHSISQFQSL